MAKFGLEAAAKVAKEEVKERKSFPRVSVSAKSGPQTVRFIMEDGPRAVLTYKRHWTKFLCGWDRQYTCPDFGEDEKTCMLCAGEPGKTYREDSCRVVHVFQVIDRADDKVKLLEIPSAAYQLVLAQYEKHDNSLDDRDYVVQLKVEKNEKGKDQYRWSVVAGEEEALSKKDKAIIAEGKINLEEVEPPYDEKDIKAMIAREASEGDGEGKGKKKGNIAKSILADDDDDDDSVEEVVKKAKKAVSDDEDEDEKPAKKASAASDEDEDEDDDAENARIRNLFSVLKKKQAAE